MQPCGNLVLMLKVVDMCLPTHSLAVVGVDAVYPHAGGVWEPQVLKFLHQSAGMDHSKH